MYVMTKDQAQEWLNRPEHENVIRINCLGKTLPATWEDDVYRASLPFAIDFDGTLTRKKPWHWPKPDENTPIDAKVWARDFKQHLWERKHYSGQGFAWEESRSSWTAYNSGQIPWNMIVLANPDDLDEVPPMDLEV